MKLRNIIYSGIATVCVLSVGVGIYAQVNGGIKKSPNINLNIITNNQTNTNIKTAEDYKKEFNDMFDNKIHIGNYDTSGINKIDNSKDIVYTIYDLQEAQGNYDVNIVLPFINITGDVANNFNKNTQNIFANKANEIFEKAKKNTIYTISYTGYINGDIMSVIIRSKLKEDTTAQRLIVQTYNYNLKTGKEATIEEAIAQRGITKQDVEKRIKNQINQAIKEANDIRKSGYDVYARNIDNDMYKVENTSTFYIGEDGTLYIIYAYGNNEITSEMDIIVI